MTTSESKLVSSKINAALELTQRGMYVRPQHGLKDGRCTCGDAACNKPGLHGAGDYRYGDATRSSFKVEEFWEEFPDANISIDLGMAARDGARTLPSIVALKIVPASGGLHSLAKLGLRNLPDTVTIGLTPKSTEVKYLLFKFRGDIDEANLSTYRLGPGLSLYGIGYSVPVPTPGDERIRWIRGFENPPTHFLDDPSVASLPEQLLTTEPIPKDEDEFSSGPLQRARIDLEQGELPEPLYDDLLLTTGVHVFFAEPGIGKSLSAMAIAVKLMSGRKAVMYFDADGNAKRINDRLLSMGAKQEDLEAYFYYYTANTLTLDAVSHFEALIDYVRPALVIFDNLTNLFSCAGVNENDNVAITGWFNAYPAKVRDRSAAALLLDHPAKSGQGRYARGGSSKLAEEDVSWSLTQPKAFGRDKVGSIRFKLEKDNEGVIPTKSLIYRVGGKPFAFEPTEATELTTKQREVLDVLDNGATTQDWLMAAGEAGISRATLYRAKETLLSNGLVLEEEGRFYRE